MTVNRATLDDSSEAAQRTAVAREQFVVAVRDAEARVASAERTVSDLTGQLTASQAAATQYRAQITELTASVSQVQLQCDAMRADHAQQAMTWQEEVSGLRQQLDANADVRVQLDDVRVSSFDGFVL